MGRCFVSRLWSLVLGTLASTEAYGSSQINNQCSTSAREKNDHSLGTKPSNRTLCFFLGIPIYVEILLIILIGDQYDPKKLVLVFLFKKFFYIYIELRR